MNINDTVCSGIDTDIGAGASRYRRSVGQVEL